MRATLTINYTDGTEEDDLEVVVRSERTIGMDVMEIIQEHEEASGREASSFVLVVSL